MAILRRNAVSKKQTERGQKTNRQKKSQSKNVFKRILGYLKSMTIRETLTHSIKKFLRKSSGSFSYKRKMESSSSKKESLNESSGGEKMSTRPMAASHQSTAKVVFSLLHRFMVLCVRFVLVKIRGVHGPAMAPIRDLILLESATSLAYKIRTRKVCSMKL